MKIPGPLALFCGIFVFLAAPAHLPAQVKNWDPIPAEEMALKEYKPSPGTHAIVLFREEFYDDSKSISTYHRRLKILTEEGKKYANIEISFASKYVKIQELRARTVRPDGTSVDFTGQVFERTLAKTRGVAILAKTFTLPEVSVGSIIEYSYKLQWPTTQYTPLRVVLQDELPTMRLSLSRKPFVGGASVSPVGIVTFSLFRLTYTAYGLPAGKRPETHPDGIIRLDLGNIPPFVDEDFIPPKNELTMRVDFFYTRGMSREAFWKDFATPWYEISQKFIEKHDEVDRLISETIQPSDPAEQKLRKLYARAQQVRNLSFERSRTEKEEKRENIKENKTVKDVLRNGYGTGLDINLLFLAMARAAGFDASMVWISGRHRNFFNPNVQDRSQLNAHVISVHLGADDIYLDPATTFSPYAMLPWEETGVQGLKITKDGGVFIQTPQPKSEEALTERKATLKLLDDGSVEGKLEIKYNGQSSLTRRLDAFDEDDAGRRKQVEDEVKGWLPTGAKVEIESIDPWGSSQDPLRVECKVTIPNVATVTGRRELLPAALFQFGRRHAFQSATRVHPVYFSYPYQENDDITLELPAAYHIESLPNALNETSAFAEFHTSFEKNEGSLHFRRHFAINGIYFSTSYYKPLREFFDKVRASDEQQVVLQSATSGK